MGYRRSRQEQRRLKKLYEQTKHSCRGGAWYDEDKGRYIRYAASNTPGYTKLLRRITNRRVRRSRNLMNNCTYKKAFDYWWQLF